VVYGGVAFVPLDDQKEAEKWAGQTVNVTGELDSKKSAITIKTIQPVK